MSTTTFRITVPHSEGCPRFGGWFFANGWRGIGPTEQRDRGGRLPGTRQGRLPEWFVLTCKDPYCEGRAVVPASLIEEHARTLDPHFLNARGPRA